MNHRDAESTEKIFGEKEEKKVNHRDAESTEKIPENGREELDAVDLELLLVGEAAKLLRCSASCVYRAIQEGKLRGVRMGRLVRVRRVDLALFVQERVR